MDGSIFRWINRLANRTSWAHWFFSTYANYGIVLFALLLVVSYLDARQRRDVRGVAGSVWAGCATLIALGIGQVIGGAVNRARPYEAMTNVHVLIDRTTDFSFPSDHATAVGAVAVGLLLRPPDTALQCDRCLCGFASAHTARLIRGGRARIAVLGCSS
jgi:undecaprenyl-diphosphatase